MKSVEMLEIVLNNYEAHEGAKYTLNDILDNGHTMRELAAFIVSLDIEFYTLVELDDFLRFNPLIDEFLGEN